MNPKTLPPSVQLVNGPEEFKRLDISTPLASAAVYLYGAQVASFTPAGASDLLYFSGKSYFQPGKPMRGGAPVIFPWFGDHATDPSKPAHGFARTREWALESATQSETGEVQLVLRLDPDADAAKWWPEGGEHWTLRHRITIGRALTMELEVENRGTEAIHFEEALHTYFSISDIHQTEVQGLENTEYLTIIEDLPRKPQGPEPIRFTRETDRVYLNTGSPIVIRDPQRSIVIEKEGAASVIVWNPWVEKAERMQDFETQDWPQMLCVETGNAKENRIELSPATVHRSRTTIQLQIS